jgi:hypothetical protein
MIEKMKSAVNRKSYMSNFSIRRRNPLLAYSCGSRAASVVLLAIFLLPLFTPFFNLGSESSLPACCRRDGKHQCAMSARFRQPVLSIHSGPIVRALTPTCPHRSRLLMPLVSRVLFVPSAQAFSAPAVSYPKLNLETVRLIRLSEFRSHRKRGPPSLHA